MFVTSSKNKVFESNLIFGLSIEKEGMGLVALKKLPDKLGVVLLNLKPKVVFSDFFKEIEKIIWEDLLATDKLIEKVKETHKYRTTQRGLYLYLITDSDINYFEPLEKKIIENHFGEERPIILTVLKNAKERNLKDDLNFMLNGLNTPNMVGFSNEDQRDKIYEQINLASYDKSYQSPLLTALQLSFAEVLINMHNPYNDSKAGLIGDFLIPHGFENEKTFNPNLHAKW